MLKCNYRCLMLSTNFSTNCASNFDQNTDILITLGNTADNNIESRFPNHVFYINLVSTNDIPVIKRYIKKKYPIIEKLFKPLLYNTLTVCETYYLYHGYTQQSSIQIKKQTTFTANARGWDIHLK